MNAHDFAMKLLEGPDLPLLIPKVVEWDDSDDCCTEPVVTKEEGRVTATDEPCDVLILSYRDGVPSQWGQRDDIAIEAAKNCVDELFHAVLPAGLGGDVRGEVEKKIKSYMKAVLAYERFRVGDSVIPAEHAATREWRAQHEKADYLIASKKSGRLFAAVYYEPSASDEAERIAFWRSLNQGIADTGI